MPRTTIGADSAAAELAVPPQGRFGAPLDVGAIDRVMADIDDSGGAWYVPAGRCWVVRVPADLGPDERAHFDDSLSAGVEAGLLALHQKCPHLGCRVPFCVSSGWFECPCHGSRFTRTGEHRSGPGPRGLDSFPIAIVDGRVVIDTAEIVRGPAEGTVVIDEPPVGPHCVDAVER